MRGLTHSAATRLRCAVSIGIVGGSTLLAAQSDGQPSSRDRQDSPEQRIECPATLGPPNQICATDLSTYIGWRVFERHCTACHGGDGLGSTFAPSLVHRVAQLDRRRFYSALDDGYAGRFTGMRPWGENPEVAPHYAELWSYLSARAEARLPAGPLRPLRALDAGR